MTLQKLSQLIESETATANIATTAEDKALHIGQARAFAFILEEEVKSRTAALTAGIASQHPKGSPAFRKAFDKAARAHGLLPRQVTAA